MIDSKCLRAASTSNEEESLESSSRKRDPAPMRVVVLAAGRWSSVLDVGAKACSRQRRRENARGPTRIAEEGGKRMLFESLGLFF